MKVSGPAVIWRKTVSGGAVRSFDEAYRLVDSELRQQADSEPVFAAHLEMLEDPMLRETVEANIAAGMSETTALEASRDSIVSMFEQIDDEYLRARIDDVRDVFARLDTAMRGSAAAAPAIAKGSVLVAEELLPSDTSQIDFGLLAGILCSRGSSTSHVCIIAHSRAVPIQVGVDISGIKDGDTVTVDDPMVGGVADIVSKVRAASRKLYVNAGNVDEVRAAIASGADGIGLFRTEFLFLHRDSMPGREEHRMRYREALLACEGKPLTLRTMDVGGDKQLPYMPMPKEENPFLGMRGIRCCLGHLEFFQLQLGGAVDAARDVRELHPEWFRDGSPLRLMLPMVCKVEEIRQVKDILHSIAPDYAELLSMGIMIETPAAVLDAAALAEESAFFSVGTNDLTQYIMAADRGNASVAHLYDAFAAPVQRALEMVVTAAHAAGIPVGICGELASVPAAASLLIALGFDSVSVSRL